MISDNVTNILQWNIRGMTNKKKELLHIIQQYKVSVLALQETQLSSDYLFKIKHCTSIGKSGIFNRRQHGGVCLYIHEDAPFSQVQLDTSLQAVAATVKFRNRITICNIYIPPTSRISLKNLQDLYIQLPQPCTLIGDFNAHSQRWGSDNTNARGKMIENFIDQTNLIILNNGSPHPL